MTNRQYAEQRVKNRAFGPGGDFHRTPRPNYRNPVEVQQGKERSGLYYGGGKRSSRNPGPYRREAFGGRSNVKVV